MIEVVKRAPPEKKVIVAGCLPLISYERLRRSVRFDGLVGPAFGPRIVDVVRRVLAGETVIALENALRAKPSLSLPRVRKNSTVSLIPISYGCLGKCSYCCVVFARGCLRSYPVEEIVNKVECDLAAGVKEFWITSQDTGCYGRDIGTNLSTLVNSICTVPGDFRVRVGMMTPNYAADIMDELVKAFGNTKVFKFLHLPVQSGDNEVLKRMNRRYTVQEFKAILNEFNAAFHKISLSTDVICGFPGEKTEAFAQTLQLIEEVRPDIVNVSKFFARPGTPAAAMTEGLVSQTEIKRRSSAITRLAKQVSLNRNQQWIDWKGEVRIDEKGKVAGSWIGRNFAYKPIVVESNADLLGKSLTIRVVAAFNTYLKGVIAQ